MLRVSLCQRNKSKNIFTWYARIFDTETKEIRYESLGTTKKTEAHDLMLAKLAAGEFARDDKSSMKLGKAFELYLSDVESRGSNARTIVQLQCGLDKLKELFERPIASITKAEIIDVMNRNAAHLNPASYNYTKTIIKTAFKFARDVLEVIENSPAECLKSRKNTSREREFWTIQQIEKILDHTHDPCTRLAYAFMAYEGLRIHEAINVKPSDIKDGFLSVIGKGNKYAKIPLCSRMENEIKRIGNDFDLSSLTVHVTYMRLRDIARRALGNTFSGAAHPHRFRHSFASNLIRAGVNVKSVQKLMRHSNIQTTLNIYSHIIEEDLTSDIEKMFDGY